MGILPIGVVSQAPPEGTNDGDTSNALCPLGGGSCGDVLNNDYALIFVVSDRKKVHTPLGGQHISGKGHSDSGPRRVQKSHVKDRKLKDIPIWCSGAAFQERHLEWMLSNIFKEIVPIGFSHTSIWTVNYQGLTRSFRHGKIYYSSITAQLVNMKQAWNPMGKVASFTPQPKDQYCWLFYTLEIFALVRKWQACLFGMLVLYILSSLIQPIQNPQCS
ncbi:putative DNA cross-link repair protein pso2/snm1 [Corchorus olitorius]|uniref:DNA cross-link repair protein pso2/snm1 n=1 Tax=Corchorus olitorius TaxID=93759 RepID=A0A1R3I3Y1_9ROSI|nr:putative DNA cross-link repair protein pso2/snm1 [Corchorus olitorius]